MILLLVALTTLITLVFNAYLVWILDVHRITTDDAVPQGFNLDRPSILHFKVEPIPLDAVVLNVLDVDVLGYFKY